MPIQPLKHPSIERSADFGCGLDRGEGYLRHTENSAVSRYAIAAVIALCLVLGVIWRFIPHPALAVVLGAIPVAMIFVLGHTFLMVLFFVVFSFFRIHEVFPQLYSLKIPLLLSLASIFSLSWHVGFSRKIQVYWRVELTVAAIFFFLVILGVIMASNRPIAIEYFKGVYWKIIVMMFAIAWLTRVPKDFSLASKIITVAGCLVGLVALMNKAQGIGLVEGTRVTIGRAIGSVLGDPNDLALVLMFPSAFAVSLLLTNGVGKFSRLLGIVSVPMLFFAIIATQSRGGLLGVIAVFGIFGIRKIKSKLLLFSLGGILAIFLFIFAGISDRKSGGAAEEGMDASAQGRLYAWEAAVGMAVSNPITGVGIDNFYSNYYYYSKHWDGLNHAVHSTWFGVLAETGFVGFAVFVIFIIFLMKAAARSVKQIDAHNRCSSITIDPSMQACSQAIYAGLVGTVVSGTFLTHGFTWPIYILAGLVVAMSKWTADNCKAE